PTSSTGTARECVEIARAIQGRAEVGVRFDDIAVLAHAPGEYAAHVEEALRRADIPAYFVRGTRRPHAAGRALLALLACAAEQLSARRFAEYLSLAQVPTPAEAAQADAFTAVRDDLLPARVAELAAEIAEADEAAAEAPPAVSPGIASPAPWRWDRLLTDAAVIGGRERWESRLAGLEEELRLQAEQLEDHEEARAAGLERRRHDLRALAEFALPLVQRLSELPGRASWGEWLQHLDGLVRAAIREPGPVLLLLAELAPSGPVGPVGLEEVRIVLAPRLRELPVAPPRRRHGAVFVGTPESARGLSFDTVFVPGLAERIFPGKIVDDPLLPEALRRRIGAGLLETQDDRAAGERLALRLAVGAARTRVVLSYPRVDVEQARSRVPSFYLLEARRAVEGRLLGFDELSAKTRSAPGERLGWPAPGDPDQAIDEAEYDLALLAPLIGDDDEKTAGTARYLLGANVHLARALRARGRRWLKAWTPADGLVDPTGPALDALARHRTEARSFSPTALQNYAACPYRFFLQALIRLAPAEEAVAIETLDPLTRGAIFHDAQFEILTELRERGWLPVRPERIEAVLDVADERLDRVAESERERLAPAIPRVWEDAVAALRADLREWLRRAAEDESGWTPYRFELSFGIVDRDRRHADPASTTEPVPLDVGLRLRGSIDLVERSDDGRLRVTDHKTGRVRAEEGVVIGKGEVLQPILYALAAGDLLRAPVEAGRLYYCTSQGGFTERVVPLDASARGAAVAVAEIVGRAIQGGFLPAAPREGACRFCDYRPVCGPYEEIRVKRKPRDRLADLARLRELE
ncbi:MAG TPA: PD-(D/E)XK nuclease family protein, partial [Myxococcota bacterium]|nr:PD-(D/E)XK nuclease family protein [Myxococcota bacterium]